MSGATGEEVRAYHISNSGRSGLSCFAPVINIMRDPRWGRNQETYGEDPYLNGMLATAYVKGIHGDDKRYMRATAGCKHFNVHGGPENIPENRNAFDAHVSMRDWRTTFLPAFRYCVEAGTYNIMCSYNRINGIPSCANKQLLTDILRKEWGFKGYVVSDMNALENIVEHHHYSKNYVEAAAAAINAGCNLELRSGSRKTTVFESILNATKQGKITEATLRERVKPLFYTRMRLGEFDPSKMNPYSSVGSVVLDDAHRELALEAAMKSIVLLKNDGLLPLTHTKYNTIAIVGPFSNNKNILNGDYTAKTDPHFVVTPDATLKTLGHQVHSVSGCKDSRCNTYDSKAITTSVHGAQLVFVCLGLGTDIEREGHDRSDLNLPGHQSQLLDDVIKSSGTAKIVLIMFNAGPVDIQHFDSNPRISAILAAFYPGQATGDALLKVVTGSHQAQFGRLPYTWYHSASQVPPMIDYKMEGRTYRYFKGKPLYPFGYGLTYTKFHYGNLKMDATVHAGRDLKGSVVVTNTGSVVGDEVVQIYISWAETTIPKPQLELVFFDRVTINAHSTSTVQFDIKYKQMALLLDNVGWRIEPGKINVYVGGQQPNQKKSVGSNVLEGSFTIHGTKLLGHY
ncbi:uncharacterized protein LOC126811774 [Patella vulgata]|uniref:uncharacterized protein LOC126811774 n=1 Tax=Patella vulgata TaxID=6465 RepID=UPI00218039A8|nr:uncharacterized protein LOC126811774 [Patella vulgata]